MPDRMAEKKMKWDFVSAAMTWARVVFPQPGGPQKINDERLSVSIMLRRMRPSPSRCSWPVNSAILRGRIRSARGAAANVRPSFTDPGAVSKSPGVALTSERLTADPAGCGG